MKSVFIVAGESSGDLQGSLLVDALRRLEPGIRIEAVGGPLMRQAGAEVEADLTGHAVIGIFESIRSVSRVYSVYRGVVRHLRERRPDAVVLIDYPEFNLRLARTARKLGIPVVYYISPQLWAWRQWRVRSIRKNVDRMLVVFPFEVEFYRGHGVQAEFVGHPLVETLAAVPDRETSRRDLGLGSDRLVLGLLPGSRTREVEQIFPLMLRASDIIRKRLDKPVTLLCAKAPSLDDGLPGRFIAASGLHVTVVSNNTYRVIRSSDLLLTASGTATVEAMILGAPMVVVYRVSLLTWALFSWMIKVPRYAMVNIIAGREIVPECMQRGSSPEAIARAALAMLEPARLRQAQADLSEATSRLGGASGGPARKAAERILETISRAEAAGK